MIWCSKEFNDHQGIEILCGLLNIEFPRRYFFTENSNLTTRSARILEDFLDNAEIQAEKCLERAKRDIYNPELVINLLSGITIDHLEGIRYGIDYNIEIRSRTGSSGDPGVPGSSGDTILPGVPGTREFRGHHT